MIPLRYSLSLLLLFTACSGSGSEWQEKTPSPEAQKLALAADPGATIGVVAAKEKGAGAEVTVEGRVWDETPGFAVIKLMDTALFYCGQKKPEACPTPWDFCCDNKERRLAHSLLVHFRGADGKPLATPAVPNTRLCDLVKVKGKMEVNEHGTPVLVATGIYQVERPTLHEGVRWPQ